METILNTLENKAKFFGLYYKQGNIWSKASDGLGDSRHYLSYDPHYIHERDYLLLKPLSSISDEDVIEVAKIMDRKSLIDIESNKAILTVHKRVAIQYISDGNTMFRDFETVTMVTDYLRSRGYALPWNGLSVEKQIEYNWIKLTH